MIEPPKDVSDFLWDLRVKLTRIYQFPSGSIGDVMTEQPKEALDFTWHAW